MEKKVLNIPNTLSLFRFILIPIISYFIWIDKSLIAIGLFIFALLTDLIDGYIARKFNMQTRFGEIADPIADKLLLGVILFTILIKEGLEGWIGFYIFSVIVFLLAFSVFLKKKMHVGKLGKVFLAIQSLLFILMIYGIVNNIILTIYAVFLYIPAFNYLSEMMKK